MRTVGKYQYSAFSSDMIDGQPRPVLIPTAFSYDKFLERL
jgi:hypothetical protein